MVFTESIPDVIYKKSSASWNLIRMFVITVRQIAIKTMKIGIVPLIDLLLIRLKSFLI